MVSLASALAPWAGLRCCSTQSAYCPVVRGVWSFVQLDAAEEVHPLALVVDHPVGRDREEAALERQDMPMQQRG